VEVGQHLFGLTAFLCSLLHALHEILVVEDVLNKLVFLVTLLHLSQSVLARLGYPRKLDQSPLILRS
jgi:hypothetical protein